MPSAAWKETWACEYARVLYDCQRRVAKALMAPVCAFYLIPFHQIFLQPHLSLSYRAVHTTQEERVALVNGRQNEKSRHWALEVAKTQEHDIGSLDACWGLSGV